MKYVDMDWYYGAPGNAYRTSLRERQAAEVAANCFHAKGNGPAEEDSLKKALPPAESEGIFKLFDSSFGRSWGFPRTGYLLPGRDGPGLLRPLAGLGELLRRRRRRRHRHLGRVCPQILEFRLNLD